MTENLTTSVSDELEPLDRDEIEADEEARADAAYEKSLKDKGENYRTLRKLRPISRDNLVVAMSLVSRNDKLWSKTRERVLELRDWTTVEGGEVRAMEVPYTGSADWDSNGYLGVRPLESDQEITLRVWDGQPITAIIRPRSDAPLPRSGQGKEELLKQMEVITDNRLGDYYIWLKRIREPKSTS